MVRMRRGELRAAVGVLAAIYVLVCLGGCGEQDLYKPPHSPYQIVAHLDLPSSAEDVSVLGDHAYVAGGEAGLHVVDITDPHAPVLKETFDTKKFAESIRVAAAPAMGRVVNIAFVVEGTEGITTYDVTDPDSTISFHQGTTAVDGNGMFIEIPPDPADPYIVYLAENWHGIRIFESDPAVPGLLRYNGVFSATRGYAKAISVAKGYAYVADDEMGLAVVDVRVRTLGVVRVVAAEDTPGKALGVDVKLTSDQQTGYAFIADGPNGLVVMAVNGGQEPVIVGGLALPGTCRQIEVRDEMAFIAAQDGGLHIVDVSDPTNPILAGTVVTPYATGVGLASSGVVVLSDRNNGFYVLTGPGAFRDRTPPGEIGDLAAAPVDSSRVRLTWRAPGNDLFQGTASVYDIRYSTTPISNTTWDTATQASGEPTPLLSGTVQSFDVRSLLPGTAYYFAMTSADAAGNASGLSNVVLATTPTGNVPPILTGGGVVPLVGTADATLFDFQITYEDGDGDVPTEASVVINEESFPLTMLSGSPVEGAIYGYETTLGAGSYVHYFVFADGHGNRVTTSPADGPFVGTSFLMGSPNDEPGREPDETAHTVVMTVDIEVADHEVTQAEYQALVGTNPSRFSGADRPVENVTWYDAVAYCNARSLQEGLTPAYAINGTDVVWNRDSDGYRLPTEAEWERAARAGSSTGFATGDLAWTACTDTLSLPDPVLDPIGWYCGNAGAATHEVKLKEPNPSGLYDMHGNVYEWCWDWYGPLGTGVAVDPSGPPTGIQKVRRGGSWYHFAQACRSGARDAYYPSAKDDNIGFRVVKTLTR